MSMLNRIAAQRHPMWLSWSKSGPVFIVLWVRWLNLILVIAQFSCRCPVFFLKSWQNVHH